MQDYNLGPSVSVEAVGDKYDQTATYAVGDYCIKDDKLYVCNTAIETAEAWNASHWTDTTIADVLKTIPSVVDNLTTNDGTKALSAAQGKNLKDQIPAVVNNLTSDSTTSALSAAQGKVLNSKLVMELKDSAVDLNTLVTDNYGYTKKWCGNTCVNLTNAPANTAVPWDLEAGTVGNNINYQWQEFRLYQAANAAGSKVYRRQKYYYGVNDFRWNSWVSIDDSLARTSASASTLYNSTSSSAVTFQKVNRVCMASFSIQCDKQLTSGTEYEIVHGIPNGYGMSMSFNTAPFVSSQGRWTFKSDGNIYFTPSSTLSQNTWLAAICTYITA